MMKRTNVNKVSPLKEKALYFKQLEKKKVDHQHILENIRTNQIYDEFMRKDEDFSYFSIKIGQPKVKPQRVLKPEFKFKLFTEAERVDKKYEKKKVMIDDFSKIYLLKNENNNQDKYNQNKNNIFFYAYHNNKYRNEEKLNKISEKQKQNNNIVGYLPMIIVNNL